MASEVHPGGPAPREAGRPAGLRLGTWNMSHWSAPKISMLAATVDVDVLAVQETHLAALPLEVARKTARNAGWRLHHGRPAAPSRNSEHGRSCGVGFLVRDGVPVLPSIPSCPAWRRLHAMRRLHGVRLAPRDGLPLGLLVLSLYAPLHTQATERACFDNAVLDLVHALDMQIPTFIVGDFNGSANPARDYGGQGSARYPVCQLLAHLLGPGAPWRDVVDTLGPHPLPMTFRNAHKSGDLMTSRIDLILANAVALPLAQSVEVLEDVHEGGHLPVIVNLRFASGFVDWQPPRPRVPPWLAQPSAALRVSSEWAELLAKWEADPRVRAALDPLSPHSLDSLSAALRSALDTLVTLAGGWSTRCRVRRLAYDSEPLRQLRRSIADLHRLRTLCKAVVGAGNGTGLGHGRGNCWVCWNAYGSRALTCRAHHWVHCSPLRLLWRRSNDAPWRLPSGACAKSARRDGAQCCRLCGGTGRR